MGDTDGMAAPALTDFDGLLLKAVKLQDRAATLEKRLARLQDRQAAFPSELSERTIAQLTVELAENRAADEWIRAQLLPIMRAPERRA